MTEEWQSLDLTLEEAMAIAIGANIALYRQNNPLINIRKRLDIICEGAKIEYIDSINVEGEFQTARKLDLDFAESRRAFAEKLFVELGAEITRAIYNEPTIIKRSPSHPISTDFEDFHFTGKSFDQWAQHNEITIPFDPASISVSVLETEAPTGWQQVEIKLMKDYKIMCILDNIPQNPKYLHEVDLFDRTRNEPNAQAKALGSLATKKKFGVGTTVSGSDKTCKSKLAKSLRELTGLKGEPFFPRTSADGYIPRFKITDVRNDADERAKREAAHSDYKETPDFAIEDDPAAKFLQKHGN